MASSVDMMVDVIKSTMRNKKMLQTQLAVGTLTPMVLKVMPGGSFQLALKCSPVPWCLFEEDPLIASDSASESRFNTITTTSSHRQEGKLGASLIKQE